MKCNWAPVKLQSSELTLLTCDRLSHQTSPYDIKKHTQQKYPSQLTLRSSVTASWGAGVEARRGCCCQCGWWRVGAGWLADPAKKGGAAFLELEPFPVFFPQTLSLRLSALGGVLQQRLNLFVSVVSVVAGPMPGSPTVITVFTKWQDRVPEIWIAHESINGLLTAGCMRCRVFIAFARKCASGWNHRPT